MPVDRRGGLDDGRMTRTDMVDNWSQTSLRERGGWVDSAECS